MLRDIRSSGPAWDPDMAAPAPPVMMPPWSAQGQAIVDARWPRAPGLTSWRQPCSYGVGTTPGLGPQSCGPWVRRRLGAGLRPVAGAQSLADGTARHESRRHDHDHDDAAFGTCSETARRTRERYELERRCHCRLIRKQSVFAAAQGVRPVPSSGSHSLRSGTWRRLATSTHHR